MKKSGKSNLMKKSLLLLPFLFIATLVQSQVKAYVSGKNYDLQSVDITLGNLIINISEDGRIARFSSDVLNGNVDYYDDENFDAYRFGKLKNIGDIKIDYWDTPDKTDPKYGKIKSIGNINVSYWDQRVFEKEKLGKVKKVGHISIDYWGNDIIDNSRYGKMKSIDSISIDYGVKEVINQSRYGKLVQFGPVKIDYWSDDTFTDKRKYGKLKSVTGNSKDIMVVFL